MTNRFDTQPKYAIRTGWESIPVNGQPMETYLAQPEGAGPWPAVIVLMEIFGVNDHIRAVTERIAGAGYIAAAPNYYHRSTPNLALNYTDRDVVIGRKHKEQTTRDELIDDIQAVIDRLQAYPSIQDPAKLGVLGFCFGGHVAFIAATLPEIAASVSFYPGGVAVTSPGNGRPTIDHAADIHGAMLCLFGLNDPLIPPEQMDQVETMLRKAGVDSEVIRYANTGHGFFCDQRADYDPSAAEDAWSRVKAFLNRHLH